MPHGKHGSLHLGVQPVQEVATALMPRRQSWGGGRALPQRTLHHRPNAILRGKLLQEEPITLRWIGVGMQERQRLAVPAEVELGRWMGDRPHHGVHSMPSSKLWAGLVGAVVDACTVARPYLQPCVDFGSQFLPILLTVTNAHDPLIK